MTSTLSHGPVTDPRSTEPSGGEAPRHDAAAGIPRWLVGLTVVAILCGAYLTWDSTWLFVSRNRRTIAFNGERRWIPVLWGLGIAAVCAVPLVRRTILAALASVRKPGPWARRGTMLAVFVLASGYLAMTAHRQERDLDMNVQDERMYLVQARMMAYGHLWLPPHPMADFFEELFVINKPVYAGMYFPGTALLYAMPLRFGVPTWWVAVLVSGAAAAMLYRVLAEVIDGAAGLIAAVMLQSITAYRWTSVMVMSHPLMLLLGLSMFWAYLRWRREHRLGWMVVFGALSGWAAITRPVDALAYGLPLFVCVLIDLYPRPMREKVKALAVMAVAAAPLLSLQLALNKAVTGRFSKTPVQFFHDSYFPATFHYGDEPVAASPKLASAPTQFRNYYDQFIVRGTQQFRKDSLLVRYPYAFTQTLPATWLLFLMPVGVVGLVRADGRLRALAAVFVLFVTGYMMFFSFAAHYMMVIAPVGFAITLLGARHLAEFAGRAGGYFTCFFALVLVTTAVATLPECNPDMRDEPKVSLAMQDFNRQIATAKKPAVVLFYSEPGDRDAWRHEQAFNHDAPSIDDQEVVRAQDRGPRNIELVRYYAERQPRRIFYRFDQVARTLTRLGRAPELVAHPEQLLPPTTRPSPPPPERRHGRKARQAPDADPE